MEQKITILITQNPVMEKTKKIQKFLNQYRLKKLFKFLKKKQQIKQKHIIFQIFPKYKKGHDDNLYFHIYDYNITPEINGRKINPEQ